MPGIEDAGRMSEKEVMDKLRDEGINNLKDLVQAGIDHAKKSGEEGEEERASNTPWCFISDNYVYKGATLLW